MSWVITPSFTQWTPADISTALWLDAADASTVTTVSGAVSQWNDKSGNGRNVTQATAGSRPALTANGLNSRAVITFDGTEDTLTNTSAALHRNISGATVFAVSQLSVNTAGEKFIYLVTTSAGNGRIILIYNNATAGNTGFAAGGRRTIANSFQAKGVSAYSSSFAINCALFNYSAAQLSIIENGTIAVNAETFQDAGVTEDNAGGLFIGANAAGSSPINGKVAEMISLDSAASTNTRQKIEGYLAHKWGLTANLPEAHPYKYQIPTPGA
jgi:hypothetical protein